MIYTNLLKAAENGELILVDGGMCRFHLRRDKQITIHEIIVLPERRGEGIGTEMLNHLKEVEGAENIFAKVNKGTRAVEWYEKRGFIREGDEERSGGVELWHYRLWL